MAQNFPKHNKIKNINMKIKIGLFTICIALFLIGCSEKEIPKDKFYANAGGFGELRLPLIKPFYMFYYEKENWMVIEDGGFILMHGVKRLKAFENLFLFRSYGSIRGKNYSDRWFLVDIENKIKEGYTDYQVFKDTLYSRYRITTDTLSWRTPRSYSDEFKKERFMPWFPDSITNNRIKTKKTLLDLLKGM